jgi:toluene monooxygenase system protein E
MSPRPRGSLKTYSHLLELGRRPSEYDVATSRLLYHPERGFEVAVPLAAWHERYQKRSALVCPDWDRFRDPREHTYSAYVARRHEQEIFAAGVVRAAEERNLDAALRPEWLDVLEAAWAPLRYPLHGLQMAAAYVGHLAPSGRLVIALLLQTGDEIRRIQHIAYRMAALASVRAHFGADSKKRWQDAPAWQPLRRVIEQLLVTYDFSEALVALNLCVKPALDHLLVTSLRAAAAAERDTTVAQLLDSFGEDAAWQVEWTSALVTMLAGGHASNRDTMAAFVARWQPVAVDACTALGPLWGMGDREQARDDLLAHLRTVTAPLRVSRG